VPWVLGSSPGMLRPPRGFRYGRACLLTACDTATRRGWMTSGLPEVLKSERMGHEIPGMTGVYGHVMPEWRDRLRTRLQELWEAHFMTRLGSASTRPWVSWTSYSPPGGLRMRSVAPLRAFRRARLKGTDSESPA
jgi:hypothetical protein